MLSEKVECVLLPAPTSQVTLILEASIGIKQENRGEVISAGRRGAQETQKSSRTCYLKFFFVKVLPCKVKLPNS